MRQKRSLLLFGAVFAIFLLQGCDMKGQLIKDMDALYEGKDVDVSQVVQKYFPPGMKLSEVLKYLDDQGFEIVEYKQDGWRKWPNGELWQYQSKGHKMGALHHGRLVGYSAKKNYDRYLIIGLLWKRPVTGKRARISINSDDGERISSSSGFVYIDFIS